MQKRLQKTKQKKKHQQTQFREITKPNRLAFVSYAFLKLKKKQKAELLLHKKL